MARISDREIFQKNLEKLGGKENNFVSNSKLQEALKWPPEKYKAIKSQLKQENLIVVGTGYGGSVAIVERKKASKLKVFISYSHVDAELKDHLVKHLRPLEREQLIDSWVDQQINPGDDWDQTINNQLLKADLIIVLVSIDFINSKYCYDVELQKALERETEGKVRVIPVIARSCLWTYSPLGRLKALPKDGQAVTLWKTMDEAFTDVATEIRKVAITMIEDR